MQTAQTQKRQFNLSCIEKHRWHRDFLQTGQLTNDLRRFHRHGQDTCAQRQGQDRAGREGERQGSRLPHLRRCDRVRGGLEEDLGGRPRIPLGQARRSELSGADLRLAGRCRRRGRIRSHLVAPQQRLIPDGSALRQGGALFVPCRSCQGAPPQVQGRSLRRTEERPTLYVAATWPVVAATRSRQRPRHSPVSQPYRSLRYTLNVPAH